VLLPTWVTLIKKKILVVEDNDDCRELLVLAIARLGYEVLEATTGFEALARALTTRPDLIMMDLSMPDMDGDEAMVRLKANPATSDIPIIVNTAWRVGERAKKAFTAGAAEILYKPFELARLSEMLIRHLGT
jgi:CheY-like chemotaxis protein